MTANEVKERMNQWGGRREPFLFGVDFELTEGFFVPSPLQQQDVLFEVGGVTNAPKIDMPAGKVFTPHPVSDKEYEVKFDTVRRGLMRGDSFLLNLTVATALQTDWTLEGIFHRLVRLIVCCCRGNLSVSLPRYSCG